MDETTNSWLVGPVGVWFDSKSDRQIVALIFQHTRSIVGLYMLRVTSDNPGNLIMFH